MSQNDREKVGEVTEVEESEEKVKKSAPKWKTWLFTTLKILGAIFFTYTFIFAIGLLSDSFQVLGGSFLNEIIGDIQGKYLLINYNL